MPNKKKVQQVTDLSELLKSTPNFVLVKFGQTTHRSLESLRNELRKSGEKIKVVKNSLFEKAFEKFLSSNSHLKNVIKNLFPLKENSAVLTLGKDYSHGLSAFFKFAVQNKSLSFKFGFLDDRCFSSQELEHIAKLPGRYVLLANLIGSLKSPQSSLVYSLNFWLSKLIFVLKEKRK